MRLENRVAIVTGAGRNIGEEIVKLFAQEGARVAVVDLDKGRGEKVAEEINAKHQGRALPVVCDVSSGSDVEKMVKTVVQKWGGEAVNDWSKEAFIKVCHFRMPLSGI